MEQTLELLNAPLEPIAPPTDGYLNQAPLSVVGIEGYPPPYVPISPAERAILLQLMDRCKDIHDPLRHYSELYVRFLRARQWKLDDAEAMFRNMVQWRRQFDVEAKIAAFRGATGSPHPHYKLLSSYWPGKLSGYTKDGSLIWIERLGLIDPEDLFMHVSLSSVVLYHLLHLEEIEQRRRIFFSKNGYSPGFLLLQDATGIGMKHSNTAIIEYVKRFIATDSDNYPETMRQTFYINCPALFSGIYSLVKGFLDSNTQSKISLFSSGLNEKVLGLVSQEQLPICLGGTANATINGGGAIDAPIERTKVSIAAGSRHQHHIQVEQASCRIAFEFRTKGYNIEFSVVFQSGTEEEEIVFGPSRLDSHIAVVADEIVCARKGVYTLDFDNTFSKFRSKDLSYSVQLTNPTPSSPESAKSPKRRKRPSTPLKVSDN